MRYSTISQIGDFTDLTPSSSDYLLLNPSKCSGGADAPLRTVIEDAPGADGALIFPPLDGPQIITLNGLLRIRSAGDEAGYLSALDTLLASLKDALADLKAAPGELVHSGGTLDVWKYGPIEPNWSDALMTVTFALVVDSS